jgi:2-isopropylmalate synthase
MQEKITILDTTLRDGEQTPGVILDRDAKIEIAHSLDGMGVDVIEAGFARAGQKEFDAIYGVASEVQNSIVCGFGRVNLKDIEVAAKAIAPAHKQRIHTFIATSDIHMEYKLKMSPQEVIQKAIDGVSYAKTFVNDVQFSAEDATRSDMCFLSEVIDAVIEAGASTINIPDSVGFMDPLEMSEFVKEVSAITAGRAVLAVHCHDDFGFATANSVAAISSGARQIECAMNGLGERAGNAALEEVAIAIAMKRRYSNFYTNIVSKKLYETSQLIANRSGVSPQPNKAIVGMNAFRHESGIHQDGVLKNRSTYEVIDPEIVGWQGESIVLGKHSGSHAVKARLSKIGITMQEKEITLVCQSVKNYNGVHGMINDHILRSMVSEIKGY